jgi:hypothetical protein
MPARQYEFARHGSSNLAANLLWRAAFVSLANNSSGEASRCEFRLGTAFERKK